MHSSEAGPNRTARRSAAAAAAATALPTINDFMEASLIGLSDYFRVGASIPRASILLSAPRIMFSFLRSPQQPLERF